MPPVQPAVASAVDALRPSLDAVAKRLGLSTSALRRYYQGNRTPSAKTARGLAVQLRQHAAKLLRIADRLDAAAKDRRRTRQR